MIQILAGGAVYIIAVAISIWISSFIGRSSKRVYGIGAFLLLFIFINYLALSIIK